jgi:hypothetical protein
MPTALGPFKQLCASCCAKNLIMSSSDVTAVTELHRINCVLAPATDSTSTIAGACRTKDSLCRW